MIKKKAKKKAAAKKTAVRKTAKKKGAPRAKKQMNPAEVRKDIAKMVGSGAKKMARAVIAEGEKGQLATVKYLFEVAEIFPPATDGSQGTPEGDSLAKTLLDRLNIPNTPIQHDENGELVSPASKGAEDQLIAGGEKDSDSAAKADAGGKDSVLV